MGDYCIQTNVRVKYAGRQTFTDMRTHDRSPDVLRCLMGYIIDLTLVMDQLFLDTLPLKPPRLLTVEQIDMALESYINTEARKVHRQIREYVTKSTITQILRSNNAQQMVIDLIRQHRAADSTSS